MKSSRFVSHGCMFVSTWTPWMMHFKAFQLQILDAGVSYLNRQDAGLSWAGAACVNTCTEFVRSS